MKKVFVREISTIILIFPKIGLIGPVQLKIKSPSPNAEIGGKGSNSLDKEGESSKRKMHKQGSAIIE